MKNQCFIIIKVQKKKNLVEKIKITDSAEKLTYGELGGTFVEEPYKKVQVGKDQEKAQSEKDSHSKNQGGKKPN